MASRVRADIPLAVLDAVVCFGAYAAVLVLRFDGAVPSTYWHKFQGFVPVAVLVQLASNAVWRLYHRMWRHASVQEARRVVMAGATSLAVVFALFGLRAQRVPLAVIVLGSGLATGLMGIIRFQARLFAFHRVPQPGLRIAVVGADDTGAAIVREMLRTPEAGLRPVVVVDDDPRARGRSLMGLPVCGPIHALPEIAARFAVDQAFIEVRGSGEQTRRASAAAEAADIPLKVLPPIDDILHGRRTVSDARALQIEDLLGRKEVVTDLGAVQDLLRDRRVLITGGGGSIGTEIARQVMACSPALLVLLDHDETHLHDTAAVLAGPIVQALADIRDAVVVEKIFFRYRPQIVFHAAAHKHVPILEAHPGEAVATNVMGTANIVDAAKRAGTRRLVFISTDKAVRPASVMGASKWLGEQIVLAEGPPEGRYCAVRFGNVLGSRGSVIPTFARQIAAGGPVTVTDPRMSRFFMSVEEAVQLVLQASVFAEGGEVFMLEMGQPVNILDLAKRMIRLSGYAAGTEIPIRIIGIRPGEKLAEELRIPGETIQATSHPSIVRLEPLRLPGDKLRAATSELHTLAHDQPQRARAVLDRLAAYATTPGVDEELIDLTGLESRHPWTTSTP